MANVIWILLTQYLSYTPTSKMTNTQPELSLRELSVPMAMKLFHTDMAHLITQLPLLLI